MSRRVQLMERALEFQGRYEDLDDTPVADAALGRRPQRLSDLVRQYVRTVALHGGAAEPLDEGFLPEDFDEEEALLSDFQLAEFAETLAEEEAAGYVPAPLADPPSSPAEQAPPAKSGPEGAHLGAESPAQTNEGNTPPASSA